MRNKVNATLPDQESGHDLYLMSGLVESPDDYGGAHKY
jgi:hypothetical protein